MGEGGEESEELGDGSEEGGELGDGSEESGEESEEFGELRVGSEEGGDGIVSASISWNCVIMERSCRVPVFRLSMTRIKWPSSWRRFLMRFLPIKPQPPVIRKELGVGSVE